MVVTGSVVTLRAAIQEANAQLNGNVQVIMFDPSLSGQQIILSGFELPITNKIWIDGLGAGQLTINGNNLSRVFNIGAIAGNVWVSGLTLTGGYNNSSSAYGGAIYNAGASLNLQNVTIQNSKASSSGGYSCGGAIYSVAGGNLQAQSCSFLSDSVNGYYDDGGAIYMGGAVNTMGTIWSGGILCLNQCTFTGNSPGGSYPYGGAIYVGGSNGSATITNSSFTGNSAYYGGGAIYSGGNYSVSVSDSSFTSNSSNGNGYGGALYGGFMLLRDTLTGNAACQGGAWYGSGTMTDSTVMNNSATSDGGGIYANGNLTLTTSTVAGNTAAGNGGGISDNSSSYQVKVYQSTISGNRATGSSSLGGGINNYANETLTVVQSTVTLNQASQGGGLYNAGTATVQNTIIAGNTATGAGQDVYGAFLTTSAYNVIGIVNNSTGLGDDPNTRAGTTPSPLLVPMDALGYNGGLTPTHVLIGGANPALNAGSTALAVNSSGQALSTDQRGTGYPRVLGSSVDAGATEGYWANTSPGLTGFRSRGRQATSACAASSRSPGLSPRCRWARRSASMPTRTAR